MAKIKAKKELKHKAGGLTFYLKKMPAGVFLMALSVSDKPAAPVVEVEYADGSVGSEVNRREPKYLRELALWQSNYNARIFRLCVVYGISRVEHADGTPANPDDSKVAELRFIYGDIPGSVARHYWYAEVIGDTASGFMNLVMGQSDITQEGLKKDERRFRPSGEGSGVQGESDGVSPDSEVASSLSGGVRTSGSSPVRRFEVDRVSEAERDE